MKNNVKVQIVDPDALQYGKEGVITGYDINGTIVTFADGTKYRYQRKAYIHLQGAAN